MSESPVNQRQMGRHVFLFSKQNGHESSPTIIAKPVDITQDLPREFLRYLRTLFDILDENGTGFVRLADIETRWKTKHGENGLSEGVIESLRKVTPKNGLLSFERLCTGMKLALKTQPRAPNGKVNGFSHGGHGQTTKRSNSLPQLDTTTKDWTSDSSEDSFAGSERREKVHIIKKLRDWKEESQDKRRSFSSTSNGGDESSGSNSPSSTNGSPIRRSNSTTKVYFVGKEESPIAQTNGHVRPSPGPSETRKCNKESRLQELDEEHNLLQSGLQVIERARKWYFKRITAIQEEKLHLQNEDQYSLEQFQYELLLHKTRRKELGLDEESFKEHKHHIQGINECLARIIERKSPAKTTSNTSSEADEERRQLQEEVKRLRKEVSDKGSKITQLENDKSALIRDLFNHKTTGKNGFSTKRENNIF